MKRALFHFVIALILLCDLMFAQQSSTGGARGVVGDHPGVVPEMPPSTSGRVRIPQRVAEHRLIKEVQPQYPEDARRGRVEGRVVLLALITKDGDVKELTLISGHPLLAPAAIDAVKQWKYKPYVLQGHPVEVEAPVIVAFQLSGD
ncbi:MAG: energy transducer TonB [Terriglobales bacterium]